MPRKVGPRTVTAGEVINYFETQTLSDAALVFGIVRDRMVARTPAIKAKPKRVLPVVNAETGNSVRS